MKPVHIKEGIRYFLAASRAKKNGFKQYKGNAEEICEQIVKDCWNGNFFQTSIRGFKQFWTRDFGMCTEALLKLGYKKEVIQTLAYALEKFQKKGRVTTAITPDGKAFDFPDYAEDSLPFLINSLKLAKATDLIKKYKSFLNKEIEYYFKNVYNPVMGWIRYDKHFSSMKDYAKRYSSCYGNSLLAMLDSDLTQIKILNNPFKNVDFKETIKESLWNGRYFYEDLTKKDIITGDANTFPFWSETFTSKEMFNSALKSIQSEKLDKPFPLKYGNNEPEEIGMSIFNKEYERNTVWLHLGLCFLDVVKKYNPKQFKIYLNQYTKMIEKFKTFPEVLDKDGNPYTSLFYYSDEGMLWAAKYLLLIS